MKRLLGVDFVRFCMVGGLGFLINLFLLTLLFRMLHLPIFVSQLMAGEVALFSNFMLHHNWTYKHRKTNKSIQSLLIQFHVTSWVAIVGSALLVSVGVHTFHMMYVVALVFSSAIALMWNFVWSKFVIWKHEHEHVDKAAEA